MQRKIVHEIKLQKSVILLLSILAIGVFVNAFGPVFSIREAMAQLTGGSRAQPFTLVLKNSDNIVGTQESFKMDFDCSGCN